MTVWCEDPGAIVAEAASDSPIDRSRPQRESIVLLLLGVLNITGRLEPDDAWTEPVREAFARAGAEPPEPETIRWYLERLVSEPKRFANIRGADMALIDDLAVLAHS